MRFISGYTMTGTTAANPSITLSTHTATTIISHTPITAKLLRRCGMLVAVAWLSGNALVSSTEVTVHRAWIVLGQVTIFGQTNHLCNQQPWSTQPGHPFVGMHNEYQ